MKAVTTVIILVTILFSLHQGNGQDYRQGVLKVFTDQSMQSGSGIICGFLGSKLYIATAFHVVDGADHILVRINRSGFEELLPAQLHYEYEDDPDIDLAVLIVTLPPKLYLAFEPYRFRQADLDRIREKGEITMIGFPEERIDVNTSNEVKNLSFNAHGISTSATSIGPGFSGGAVLNRKNEQLIGMILQTSGANTYVLRLPTLIRYLDAWNIPYNLIKPYREPVQPAPIGLTGLAAGGVAWGVGINNSIKELKLIEKKYRTDEKLMEFEGMTHESLQEKVNKKVGERNLLYVLAGGSLAAAVTIHILHNKKKKKKKNVVAPSGSDLFFDRVSLHQSGTSVGVSITF